MPNSLELTLINCSSSPDSNAQLHPVQVADGIQNTSFEATVQHLPCRRSAYMEAYTDVARCRRSLSFVQTKLTKNGCVSALQRPEDGAPCWQKPVVVK